MGTTTALVAAIACAFAVLSAVVAVRGWSGTLASPDVATLDGGAPAGDLLTVLIPAVGGASGADVPGARRLHAERVRSGGAGRALPAGEPLAGFRVSDGPAVGVGSAPGGEGVTATGAAVPRPDGSDATAPATGATGPGAGAPAPTPVPDRGGVDSPALPPDAAPASGLGGTLTQVTSGAGTAVTQTGQQLGGAVQGTTGQLGGAVGQVSPAVGQAVTQTGQVVGGAVSGATGTVGQVVQGTGATVGGLVRGLIGGGTRR